MIPDIGLMVAAYILLRAVSVLCSIDRYPAGGQRTTVAVFAVLCIVATLAASADLLLRGVPDSPSIPSIRKTAAADTTCKDPHEHVDATGYCNCDPGWKMDMATLKCVPAR